MAAVVALRCVRCGTQYPPGHYAQDCDGCRSVVRSNLSTVYDDSFYRPRPRPTDGGRSLWRYGDVLPIDEADGVSLGEGGTPLHLLTRVGSALGLDQLYAKDESRNPSWSFKDRLACVAVSVAKRRGAKVIASSSSGNAGSATAAYAARAGLPCVIFAFKGASGTMATHMGAYGSTVVKVENREDRWVLMEHAVRCYGWFPVSPFFGPVVGSNPYGIEGYKTIAYEIAEGMNWQVPDWCVLPVAYGDALVGVWRGFEDMLAFGWTDRMPRMIAAEIYGSLSAALAQDHDGPPVMPKTHETVGVSIGSTRSTFQALSTLRKSRGRAVTIGNSDMLRWQAQLAATEGLYVEASSAAPLAAIEKLRRDGTIARQHSVAVLLTASGLKDPEITSPNQKPVIAVPGDIDTATRILEAAGVFSIE